MLGRTVLIASLVGHLIQVESQHDSNLVAGIDKAYLSDSNENTFGSSHIEKEFKPGNIEFLFTIRNFKYIWNWFWKRCLNFSPTKKSNTPFCDFTIRCHIDGGKSNNSYRFKRYNFGQFILYLYFSTIGY